MTKLFIENANKEAPASIRIYPLDENSQVIAPDSFTSMDDLGLSFGIALAPKAGIDCTGAFDYAGIIAFTDEVQGRITQSKHNATFNGHVGLVSGLTGAGFDVTELTPWRQLPPPSVSTTPRARVQFNSYDWASSSEPLKVTLKYVTGVIEVKQGPLAQVLDSCREMGILFQGIGDLLLIGCEPDVLLTVITVETFDDINVTYEIDTEDSFYNPTLQYINSNKFTVMVKWDGLTEFWCMLNRNITNVHPDVGGVLTSNHDVSMVQAIPTELMTYEPTGDYTEVCSNAYDPAACVSNHRTEEYCNVINQRVSSYKVKFGMFNQGEVWVPTATDGEGICQASAYTPVTTRYDPEAGQFGYAIPEPEQAM